MKLLLALSLSATVLLTGSHSHRKIENLCPGWAQQMNAGPDDPRMHSMGCDDKYGSWERAEGRCMRIAYAVSRKEFNYAKIGRQGCVLFEDGSWGDE